jgi:dTDP-4-amino-4,6-dideoxygalactose transaminase
MKPDHTHLYFRGSNAIWHALKILRLQAGDEVLFPAYHCGIELDVLSAAGLRVSFYKVGRDLTLNTQALLQHIGPRTRALYVIHYYGVPHDLTEIVELCRKQGLALIEDCAMALYSRRGTRPVGLDGDVALFSMWKTVAMPFGGALMVNNPELQGLRAGQTPSRYEVLRALKQLVEIEFKGSNLFEAIRRYCVEPFARAIRGASASTSEDSRRKQPLWLPLFAAERCTWGITGLSRHLFLTADPDAIRAARWSNYHRLLDVLRTLSSVTSLYGELPEGVCPLYCPVVVDDATAFRQFLLRRGVEAFRMWREVHPLFPQDEFAEEAYLRSHVVALPIHQHLDTNMQTMLTEALKVWDRNRPQNAAEISRCASAEQYV